MESKNAVFLINSLEGGGAERVMVNMLSILEPYFSRKPMCVYLILLDDLPEEHSCPSYVHKIVLKITIDRKRLSARVVSGVLRFQSTLLCKGMIDLKRLSVRVISGGLRF